MYLQSINSNKHLPQSPLPGKFFRWHFALITIYFIVNYSMVLIFVLMFKETVRVLVQVWNTVLAEAVRLIVDAMRGAVRVSYGLVRVLVQAVKVLVEARR
jgi:hypothetical protein